MNKTEEEINEFTDFLNQLVPGIKFKPKIRSDHIEFLDTLVTIKDGFLITSPYSKPTDSKQYLVPSSIHKPSVVENIPKMVDSGDYVQTEWRKTKYLQILWMSTGRAWKQEDMI